MEKVEVKRNEDGALVTIRRELTAEELAQREEDAAHAKEKKKKKAKRLAEQQKAYACKVLTDGLSDPDFRKRLKEILND